jgi:acyl-CoA thioester hydrolase
MHGKNYSVSHVVARYQETDQMGVIHHSVYPIWFEVGRTDLIKMVGLTYTELEKIGVMLPLINLECSYKSFAKYEDRLQIRTWVDALTNTRMSFYYEVVKPADKVPGSGYSDDNSKTVTAAATAANTDAAVATAANTDAATAANTDAANAATATAATVANPAADTTATTAATAAATAAVAIADEVLVAYGRTFHIFANRELRPVNMKKYCPDAYEKFGWYDKAGGK